MNSGSVEIRIFAKSLAALQAVILHSEALIRCHTAFKELPYNFPIWKILESKRGTGWNREKTTWEKNNVTCYVATMQVFERLNLLSIFENGVAEALEKYKDEVFAFYRYGGEGNDDLGHFFRDSWEAESFEAFAGTDQMKLVMWFEQWSDDNKKAAP